MKYKKLTASLCLFALLLPCFPTHALADNNTIDVCKDSIEKRIDNNRSATFNGLTIDLVAEPEDSFIISGTKAHWYSTEKELAILELSSCPGSNFYYYRPTSKIGDIDLLRIHSERPTINLCEVLKKYGIKIC